MFNYQGRNRGLAKFMRGFHRLKRILRFAKATNQEVDPYFIDLGYLTLFHIKARRMQMEG